MPQVCRLCGGWWDICSCLISAAEWCLVDLCVCMYSPGSWVLALLMERLHSVTSHPPKGHLCPCLPLGFVLTVVKQKNKKNPDICNKWTTNSEVELIKDREKGKHEQFCVLLYLYFWICESDQSQCACASELLLMWGNWTPLLCKATGSYGPFRGMQCLSTVFMTAMSNGKSNLYIDSNNKGLCICACINRQAVTQALQCFLFVYLVMCNPLSGISSFAPVGKSNKWTAE